MGIARCPSKSVWPRRWSRYVGAGLPVDAIVRVEFPKHAIIGMKDGDGIVPSCMDEEDAGGSSWVMLTQILMHLAESLHHQISGYRRSSFDKPVHQHLRSPGHTHHWLHHSWIRPPRPQELTLAYSDPSMIAIVGGPRAFGLARELQCSHAIPSALWLIATKRSRTISARPAGLRILPSRKSLKSGCSNRA